MNQCEPFHAELGAYHDGVLTEAESFELERHLEACGPCRSDLAKLGTLDAAIRTLPRIEPSADFAARFYARLAAEADLAPGAAAHSTVPAAEPRPAVAVGRAPVRRSRWMRLGWAGAGIAAAAAAAAALLAVQEPPQEAVMTGEDWQIVSDEDAFEVVLQEDPDLLLALDALADEGSSDGWPNGEGQS